MSGGRVFQRVKGRGKPWDFMVDVAPAGAKRRQLHRGGFQTRRAAEEAKTAVLASLRGGTFAEPSRITFGQYLTRWLATLPAQGRKSRPRPTGQEGGGSDKGKKPVLEQASARITRPRPAGRSRVGAARRRSRAGAGSSLGGERVGEDDRARIAPRQPISRWPR